MVDPIGFAFVQTLRVDAAMREPSRPLWTWGDSDVLAQVHDCHKITTWGGDVDDGSDIWGCGI